jgi:hypothetical protein
MEREHANWGSAAEGIEAARLADLVEKGNELLNEARKVARRIDARCQSILRSDPGRRNRPPPDRTACVRRLDPSRVPSSRNQPAEVRQAVSWLC